MRVLHVVASGKRRGAELFASDLVRMLDTRGVEQRVALLKETSAETVTFAADVTTLSTNGNQVPIVRMDPRTMHHLRAVVSSWTPDIIQAHGGEPLKYAASATLRRGSSPIVYRRIGSAPEEIARGPRRAAYAALMRRAARIIAVADVLRRETVRMFRVQSVRVVTIPNGVDPGRMQPLLGRDATRAALRISPRTPIVLSLGALVWEKDPLAQLEIIADVARTNPEVVLLMAGDGPMRAEVEAVVRGRGLGDRVRILGARSDVGDLLAASDVLLFASCSEGMAASVIEAGMAGLPVAAFAVGGIPEVVDDGRTGLLATSGDLSALANKTTALLADASMREAMGLAAREACARFDIREIASRYLMVYEDVARER